MKCAEYTDVGDCIIKPAIENGMVRIIVNIGPGGEQTTTYLNPKELRYLAKYIDSQNVHNAKGDKK